MKKKSYDVICPYCAEFSNIETSELVEVGDKICTCAICGAQFSYLGYSINVSGVNSKDVEEVATSLIEKVMQKNNNAHEEGYTVNHFHGPVSDTQFQQCTHNSTQTMNNQSVDISKLNEIVKSVQDNIHEINMSKACKNEIELQIQLIQEHIASNNIDMQNIINSLIKIRDIVDNFTSNIIASGILYQINLVINKNFA